MNDKTQLISHLRGIYNRWEAFLLRQTEAQISAPNRYGHWSIKDVVAHLRAWQQVSISRLEAALDHHTPDFADWPPDFNPEPPTNADLDHINNWIYEQHRDQSWLDVHAAWRAGFLHFLDLAQAIPEKMLFEVGRFPWLDEYPLAAVLEGSGVHHEEHLEPLLVSPQSVE
ncbi:MAG: ClbS/DfsB family four-helix bundle protein [Chloroflexota bacterium]